MRYLYNVISGTLVAACLIAAAIFVTGDAHWWRGFAAAGIAAGASLLVSFAIVLPAFNASVETLAYSFLVAGAVRAAALGAIIVLAIKRGGYPETPTLVLAALLYTAIVCIEGTILWSSTRGSAVGHIGPLQPNHFTNHLPTQDRA